MGNINKTEEQCLTELKSTMSTKSNQQASFFLRQNTMSITNSDKPDIWNNIIFKLLLKLLEQMRRLRWSKSIVIYLVWLPAVICYLKVGNTHMLENLIPFKYILLHIEGYMKYISDYVLLWYEGKKSQK